MWQDSLHIYTKTFPSFPVQMPLDDTRELSINKTNTNIAFCRRNCISPTDSIPSRVSTDHRIPEYTRTFITPGRLQRTRHYMAKDTIHVHKYANTTTERCYKHIKQTPLREDHTTQYISRPLPTYRSPIHL